MLDPLLVAGIMIRDARKEDASRLAEIHVCGWRYAYRGIISDYELFCKKQFLFSIENMQKHIVEGKRIIVFEDDSDGIVKGFARHGKSRDTDKPNDYELYAIYVQPEFIGKKVGTRILHAVEERAEKEQYKEIIVWVLSENRKGRDFYRKNYFTEDGTIREIKDYGKEIRMVKSLFKKKEEEQGTVKQEKDEKYVTRILSENDKENWISYCCDITCENNVGLYEKDLSSYRSKLERCFGDLIRNSVIVIIERGKEVIGTIDFHKKERKEEAHVVEFGMSIKKEYRNQGLGSKLLTEGERIVLEQWKNIKKIECEVFETNVAAIKLYMKLGYRIEGNKKNHILLRDNYIDLINMGKEILV
jgi:RimJ/RimL family protein N-acetyltransferase